MKRRNANERRAVSIFKQSIQHHDKTNKTIFSIRMFPRCHCCVGDVCRRRWLIPTPNLQRHEIKKPIDGDDCAGFRVCLDFVFHFMVLDKIELTLFSCPTVSMLTPTDTPFNESLPEFVTFVHGRFYRVAYKRLVDCLTNGQRDVVELIFLEHPDLPDGVVGFRKSSF